MERLSVLLTLCEGNPPVTVGSHQKGPVTWSFGISFMLAWTGYYNSKHSSCRWFESSLGLCDVTEWKRFFHWGCGVVHNFQRLIIYKLCIFQNSYFVFYVFGLVWLFNYTPTKQSPKPYPAVPGKVTTNACSAHKVYNDQGKMSPYCWYPITHWRSHIFNDVHSSFDCLYG